MQGLRDHIKEHIGGEIPAYASSPGALNFHDSAVRDAFNFSLSDITDGPELVDPVILYERVREAFYGTGYSIPSSTELLHLFSEMEPDGDEVFSLAPGIFLYFAFCKTGEQENAYDVLAEVVNEEELEEILNAEDAETV